MVLALLLGVGAGSTESPLAQDDGHGTGAFLDESGVPIAADRPIDGAVVTAEPALVSLQTLGAVALAVVVALLIVAAVRRADG
ncbi:hypothetical protein C463_14875 [Halorubrum californiense DSM 19288]|uniref:Uncharacterized protein n=1 Tax=Halorubrum californiense DSM 19288 TaxID=1227465 RepID=M0DYP2_9EURY|nr:hypothetical protein C463_14875 [Halorubrum californiense DSM 19288]